MNIENINVGDKVVFIPHHLLVGEKSEMVKDENLGIVTSKNSRYVFVRYNGKEHSEATNPHDLYTLKVREDLQSKII